MNNHSLNIKFYLALLLMSFSFSCDTLNGDKDYPRIKDPLSEKNYMHCSDEECDLLTNDTEREWIMVEVFNPYVEEIPVEYTWIFTFTCNYTCKLRTNDPKFKESLELVLFSWSVTKSYGERVLNLEVISDELPPEEMDWVNGVILLKELSHNILKIMIMNGSILKYEIYFDPDRYSPSYGPE